MWYREGTITFTQGSDALTGTGTFWNVSANGVLPGMIVIGPDNKLHEIKRVINDTSLILAEPYTGETQTDVPCRIITTYEGDLTQFSARFTALMNRMSGDAKAMRSWLTAVDDVTLEREDGTEMTVKPLIQIVDEHNASQQWFKDNTDAIDAAGDKAKAAAASAAAAAESESKASSKADESAASASTATTKAQESATSAAAAALSEQTALDAATRADSSAASSDSAATRAETAAAKAEEIAVDIGLVDASLTQKGIVKLSNDTDSESESLAATPKAVKAANDNANSRVPATRKVNGHSLDTDVTIENVETANKLKTPVYVCVNLASKESASFDGSANATPGVSGVLGVENGGTGGTTPEEGRAKLDVPANADVFLKSDNLQGIADRAAAWLNVRPIGATPLGGDPVNDYDATTKRWVENYVSGGGGVGPTMNGVQNFGVGTKTLWDSRAFIPGYCVPMDGQLLNRADWPELWAHAQMHSPISDADWLADKFKRVSYSTGDGSTTFRVPDLNGVHADSLWALYGRGDSGGRYPTNIALENGAPNIAGWINSMWGGMNPTASGAFKETEFTNFPNEGTTVTTPATRISSRVLSFTASNSHPAYGRASDVRPNSFVGVWIVRASGGFEAANTRWSVINEDKSEPGGGVTAYGGEVISSYKVNGANFSSASLSARSFNGTTTARIVAYNDKTGVGSELHFDEKGLLILPQPKTGDINMTVVNSDKAMKIDAYVKARSVFAYKGSAIGVETYESNEIRIQNAPSGQPGGAYINWLRGNWYGGSWTLGGVRGNSKDLLRAQLNVSSESGAAASYLFNVNGVGQAAQWQSTSDRRIKSLWETIPDPLNVMKSIRGYSWYYEPYGTQGFGFMADEVEKYFPGAVNESEGFNVDMPDGSTVEKVKSVDTYGIAAALHHEAILELMKQVEELKKEIAELKSRLNDKESASSSV